MEQLRCQGIGCTAALTEDRNPEGSCRYHASLPTLTRLRCCMRWKCRDLLVKEYDEFVSIPPCARRWHSADPTP
uniref:CHORD domain-containing protein n=1 Tax=Kalanchoe fedtschenkoi TaxID=63787 RepID=A0A7N0VAM2_KALFE